MRYQDDLDESTLVKMCDRFNALQKRELRITNSIEFIDQNNLYPFILFKRNSMTNGDPLGLMSIKPNYSVVLLTELNITNLALSSDQLKEKITQPTASIRLRPNSLMNLDEQFKRPVKIGGFVWTTSTTPVIRPDILTTYLTDPTIARLTSGYMFIRGKFHLTIMVNGFSMWFGHSIIAPFYNSNQGAFTLQNSTWDLPLAMNNPHVTIDPSKSTTYSMDLLYYQPDEWISLNVPSSNAYVDLGFFPTFLASVNTTAPTSVEIVVYMHMTDVELTVPYSNQADKGVLDMEKLNISSPLEALSEGMEKAEALLSVARTSGFAIPTSKQTRDAAMAFKAMGYGSPAEYEHPKLYKPVQTSNTFSNDYGDLSYKLTNSASASIPIDDKVAGIGYPDEKFIKAITRKWGYIGNMNWTPEVIGENLATLRISPMTSYRYPGSDPHKFRLTPLGTIAALHDYYTGSLEIKFEICCSQYHRGTLGFTNQPSLGVSNDRKPTVYPTVLADITEKKEVIMPLPCLYRTPLVPVGRARDLVELQDYSHGLVTVYSVTQLKSMGSASTVRINVYLRAGPDFELFSPTHFDSKFVYQSSNVNLNVMETDDDKYQQVDKYFEYEEKSRALELFGEKTNSIMTLVSKPCVSFNFSNTINPGSMKVSGLYLPTRPTTWGTASATEGHTWISYLSQCFLGMTGSFRIKIFGLDVAAQPTFYMAELENYGSCESAYEQIDFTNYATLGWGQCGRLIPSSNSGVGSNSFEVEIPMRTLSRFLDPRVQYKIQDIVGRQTNQLLLYFRSDAVRPVMIYESAGDDFALHHFYSTPIVLITT